MTLEETISNAEIAIADIRKKIKSLESQLTRNINKRDNALIELNKDNLKSLEWLIKNPTAPGYYDAMSAIMKELYGNEWNGPRSAGYTHDGKYNPLQANFEFHLKLYDYDEVKKAERIANCKHFVENYINCFEPLTEIESRYDNKFPLVNVVGFQFNSRSSGLDSLGYDPIEGAWYWFTTTYSRTDIRKKFENFDEAIEFAFNHSQDDNDEY